MRAKYAAAIRFGVETAKQVVLTAESSNYYTLRSTVISYGFMNRKRGELTLAAFRRTFQNDVIRLKAGLNAEEIDLVRRAHKRAWVLHTESREERDRRLTLEKMERLEVRVQLLEANEADYG